MKTVLLDLHQPLVDLLLTDTSLHAASTELTTVTIYERSAAHFGTTSLSESVAGADRLQACAFPQGAIDQEKFRFYVSRGLDFVTERR